MPVPIPSPSSMPPSGRKSASRRRRNRLRACDYRPRGAEPLESRTLLAGFQYAHTMIAERTENPAYEVTIDNLGMVVFDDYPFTGSPIFPFSHQSNGIYAGDGGPLQTVIAPQAGAHLPTFQGVAINDSGTVAL